MMMMLLMHFLFELFIANWQLIFRREEGFFRLVFGVMTDNVTLEVPQL